MIVKFKTTYYIVLVANIGHYNHFYRKLHYYLIITDLKK